MGAKNISLPQTVNWNGPDSVMVRASASEAGGRGFESGPRLTKDVKNGTSGYLIHKASTGFSSPQKIKKITPVMEIQ